MPKVIFTQAIRGVASVGEVRNVREGYYRNFLMPRRIAVMATEGLIKQWQAKREKMVIEKQELLKRLGETQQRLKGGGVVIEKKVTAKGTLYGGVKVGDIQKAIAEQLKVDLPSDCVQLAAPIKAVGSYEITVDLGDGVTAKIPVEVSEKK